MVGSTARPAGGTRAECKRARWELLAKAGLGRASAHHKVPVMPGEHVDISKTPTRRIEKVQHPILLGSRMKAL